jgi:hypothetical protein
LKCDFFALYLTTDSFIADSENFDLPEIYPNDLADLDFPPTEAYDIKEGLDADIDFIRTQLAHFQPQSFEFRILNAMLRKAEQLQVRRRLPVVTTFNLMLTNLLQKSLPNHTPEELRRRFSEEISRWQHELQSNANVDDLMDKLVVTEPSAGKNNFLCKKTFIRCVFMYITVYKNLRR